MVSFGSHNNPVGTSIPLSLKWRYVAWGHVTGGWGSQDWNTDAILQNPFLYSNPVVLPRAWQRMEGQRGGGKGGWSGQWVSIRLKRGKAGETVRLICGEERVSTVEQGCLCPGYWEGQARGRAEHGPPLLDTKLASTPWDVLSREWPLLELNELFQGGFWT